MTSMTDTNIVPMFRATGDTLPITTGPRSTRCITELGTHAVTAVIEVDADRIGFHTEPAHDTFARRDFVTVAANATGSPVVLLALPNATPGRVGRILDVITGAIADDFAGAYRFEVAPYGGVDDGWFIMSVTYTDSEGQVLS
jgi:hypothetical protein